VTRIGTYAFYDCSSLTSVFVNWESPLELLSNSVFYNSNYKNDTLYVPFGTKAAYEAAAGWTQFEEIVEIWQEEKMLLDGLDYANNKDEDIKKLQYSRTFKNTNWQAWYVPFELELTSDVLEHFSFAKFAGTYTEDEAAAINSMVVNVDGSDMVQAGDEKTSHDFIKKTAYFFTFAQVEKAPELQPLPELPEDVKKESRGGCCWISGNTYAIKDALKAAGFRWSKKNSAWYRREAA
jgi:hypothetical protein